MRLNRFETVLMNNPARAASQRWIEAPWMQRFASPAVAGGRALEMGCGRGIGMELIFAMGAAQVHGFDVDADLLCAAYRRLRRYGSRALLWTGSADDIPASEATYDVVFDFGVLHHIENWRDAIAEIARVLRPNGRFVGEEMLSDFIVHPISRALFDHPVSDRFDMNELLEALHEHGFVVLSTGHARGWVGWFAAEKASSASPRGR
jgi:ubiquinone/menaquinone biosynthesis C-methylase UbiE